MQTTISTKSAKKTRKKFKILAIIALILALIWLFLSFSVNPVLKKFSEQKVKELSSIAVNDAASKVIILESATYDNILIVDKNANGEIERMTVNSYLVNLVSREIASLTQSNISSLGEQGISIPLGSLSGLTFLAGQGPDITIKVYPVGSVDIKFDSEFVTAGINQTKHRILLNVQANVSVIMPGLNRTVTSLTQIVLCESILIGKVPDTYLNSSSLTQMLNLIP